MRIQPAWNAFARTDRILHHLPGLYLRTVMRLPVRQIRELLHTLHGFEVSIGEIVEVLHRLVAHAQPVLHDLKTTIRASPAVQADETGWREDCVCQ